MTVTENDGTVVWGSVSGTALTPTGNGQGELVPFAMTFKSNDLFSSSACEG